MGKILIVDDDKAFLELLSSYVADSYPHLQVTTCETPLKALQFIREGEIDLLLLDLEMPDLDGAKLFRFAVDTGMDPKRVVILSGRDSDYLHAHFPLGTCLAVLNKYEVKQQAVLNMIFSSLNRKAAVREGAEAVEDSGKAG